MGVLWLLSLTTICYITQETTAWTGGGNQTTTENSFENQTMITVNESSTRKPTSISTRQAIIDKENMREKRGTLMDENNLEKRGSSKNRFSSWAGKRAFYPDNKRTKFSSWGGKRSGDIEDFDDEIEEEKRARFSSWGGKRNDEGEEKRAKFSSWGGKRDFNDINDINEEKRSKFNSWAGKRMDLGSKKRTKFSSWAGKRARFNSWAGKRSDNQLTFRNWPGKINYDEPENDDIIEEKRAKFSSWGGKRIPDYVGLAWNQNYPENKLPYYSTGGEEGSENIMKLWKNLMSRKRARFSSWAGKRGDESLSDETESIGRVLDPEIDGIPAKFSLLSDRKDEADKFSNLRGKQGNESAGEIILEREDYPGIIEKRSVFSWNSPSLAYKRKPIFSSWGGKRSENGHTIQARSLPMQRVFINGVKDKSWGSLLRPIRRGPDFYAWGGKRST